MARICVPVCARRMIEMREAALRAGEVADIIELRLDYLSDAELSQAGETLAALLKSSPRPIILTLRPAEAGGAREITIEERLQYRLEQAGLSSGDAGNLFDVEFDLAFILQEKEREGVGAANAGTWDDVICSFHDFAGVPADIEQIFERMAATPARMLKIAVRANDALDCLPVWRLLERARQAGREMIAVAMGQAGLMTRVLGPSRGSFLTYASLDDESATAPGQIDAGDLRDVYRIDQIDQETKIFGIVGKPVSQSLSPRIHNASFAAARQNAVYIPFEVADLTGFMQRMADPKSRELDWNLGGLSVTAPHKSAVISHLDWIEPSAKEIGAVNTIVIKDDQLLGYNTDAEGFISPLRSRFGSLTGARCAVIGAGGAARAVTWALRNAGAGIEIFARGRDKAMPVAQGCAAEVHELSKAEFRNFDIVVNATPLGMRGKDERETPARANQLRGVRLAYDLVYNPIETRFVSEARSAGCETVSGIEMLLAQAVEQFKLWTGAKPSEQIMRETAMNALK